MCFLQHSYKKMLRFIFFYIYRFFLLNSIILKIRERKFIKKNYNYDFRNIIFEDLLFLKRIFTISIEILFFEILNLFNKSKIIKCSNIIFLNNIFSLLVEDIA